MESDSPSSVTFSVNDGEEELVLTDEEIRKDALLITNSVKSKHDPASDSLDLDSKSINAPDIPSMPPTNYHALNAYIKAKPSKRKFFKRIESSFNAAISKIRVACPEVEKQVDEMKQLFERMKESSAQHPTKYDESECFEILKQVLRAMQLFINQPEFVAVVGKTTAQLEDLSEKDVQLRAELKKLQNADDLDTTSIFTKKDQISRNLQERLDTLYNRIQMLVNDRSNGLNLEKIRNEIKDIANTAHEKAQIWFNKMNDSIYCLKIVNAHGLSISTEESQQLSILKEKKEVNEERRKALKREEQANQRELESVLLKMHNTAKKQKKNYLDIKELRLRNPVFVAAFTAAKKANEETTTDCKKLEEICKIRANAFENAMKFTNLSDPALAKGIEARMLEFKPKEVETMREFLKCAAERYQELSERLKNDNIKLDKKRNECEEQKRNQFLAIDHEDEEAAKKAQEAAKALLKVIESLGNSINVVSDERNELKNRMSHSHSTLADLGFPEPTPLGAVIDSIEVKILLKEQAHTRLAIANARANQAATITSLLERQRMIDHHLARHLTDSSNDTTSGALVATQGHGAAAPVAE